MTPVPMTPVPMTPDPASPEGQPQIEADFIAYNKTGDPATVAKYPAAEVDRFIKDAYTRDNTPSLMAARCGAILYLRTLRAAHPPLGLRLWRFLLGLLVLALCAGLLLLAAGLLARR